LELQKTVSVVLLALKERLASKKEQLGEKTACAGGYRPSWLRKAHQVRLSPDERQ
jgi:hypothetical protein